MRRSVSMVLALALAAPAAASPPSLPVPSPSPSPSPPGGASPAVDAGLPPLPRAAAWKAPLPVEARTKTGLRVVMLPRHALPLVSVLVTVRAGAALDPRDRPGLASAVAMMLADGGAGARTPPAVYEAFEALGDELRLDVDPDAVRIQLTVKSDKLPAALALLGDLLARPRFDDGEWTAARARRIAELVKQRNDPRRMADLVFNRVLFGDEHHYGHPPNGTPSSVGAVTSAELKAFWSAHYGPRTTAIVLVGDVVPREATRLVEGSFAGYTGLAEVRPAPAARDESRQRAFPRVVVVDRKGAPQTEVRVGHVGLARRAPDEPAASLLEMVLGGSFTSRLVQNLREKHGYTYGASARFQLLDGPGPFAVRSAVRTDVTGAALTEIVAELHAIRDRLAAPELEKARALVTSTVVEEFAAGSESAALLGDLVVHHLPLDTFRRLPQTLASLTPAALEKVAARVFRPDALTIVVVGDRDAIESQLRALPLGKAFEVVDVDGKAVR